MQFLIISFAKGQNNSSLAQGKSQSQSLSEAKAKNKFVHSGHFPEFNAHSICSGQLLHKLDPQDRDVNVKHTHIKL